MRKFILITAMVLASATAHAGQRNLTVASSDEPAATVPAKPADSAPAPVPAAAAPAYVERPSAAAPATDCAPKTEAEAPKSAPRDVAASEKPKRRHISTEARVISELHRHGIYW
jgi:hypothetical protein